MSASLPAEENSSLARPGAPANACPNDLEQSRRLLLASVEDAADVTFVRSVGNLGDQLILAGARSLLSGIGYREIGLGDVASAHGHTAVLAGGGAWCAPYHELMPRTLTLLESRFRRVVVFPSSFDITVPEVRDSLSRSRACVFAREPISLDLIRSLCDARLAHDTAFFFDFSPYECAPDGALDAFRTDRESVPGRAVPPTNRDISVSCDSLDQWLWTIARHSVIRTDRAHVMIAAALLGREVEYRPSSYHKVPAIAEWALAGFSVRRALPDREGPHSHAEAISEPAAAVSANLRSAIPAELDRLRERIRHAAAAPAEALPGGLESRVTIVILSRNRPMQALRALRSIRESSVSSYRVLVIDNGSAPELRDVLENRTAGDHHTDFLSLESNLGCAAGRRYALGLVTTEYVFYLDDDAEVFPGTVPQLIADLDAHPESLATTARVVLPTGRIQHCGGSIAERNGVLFFEPGDAGRALAEPVASGSCDWVPGTAFLARRRAFVEDPLDTTMAAYFEDNEWCYRVRKKKPLAFRRCAEAFVLHHHAPKERMASTPEELIRIIPYLESIAHFYKVHGLVLDVIFGMVPELRSEREAETAEAAREFLDLFLAKGATWMQEQWLCGNLDLVLSGEVGLPRLSQERELHRLRTSRLWRMANLYWIARRRVASLARRETP